MEKKIFYTSSRSEWRSWLMKNHKTENEVWFVFPSRESGEASLSYNDAVEEALCFGWIDSTTGHLDSMHGIRRFSPRREKSPYSRTNIERLINLDREGLIMPEVRESVRELIETPYVFPEDILSAIKADSAAWENFECFPAAYQRIRVSHIDAARKSPEEFKKWLDTFIAKTRDNKLIAGSYGFLMRQDLQCKP